MPTLPASSPINCARFAAMPSRNGPSFGRSNVTTTARFTTLNPADFTRPSTSCKITPESKPCHCGSVSGYNLPMSPKARLESSASETA